MGAELLVETLRGLEAGSVVPRKQDPSLATLAPILRKEDGRIDWNLPAADIYNRVRGFVPWPGAWSVFRGQLLHVWRAMTGDAAASEAPGTLMLARRRLLVACGQCTSLEVIELQLEGRKRVTSEAFVNGQRLTENERLV
jgi:methionyl-tRNA formyltransferase